MMGNYHVRFVRRAAQSDPYSLLAVCLVFQLISGITLAMHYIPNILEAFNSIEHLENNVYECIFLNLFICLFVYINYFILIVNYHALTKASPRNTNSGRLVLRSWSKTNPNPVMREPREGFTLCHKTGRRASGNFAALSTFLFSYSQPSASSGRSRLINKVLYSTLTSSSAPSHFESGPGLEMGGHVKEYTPSKLVYNSSPLLSE